jgi:nucleotide-binding universal stress UspA family protein
MKRILIPCDFSKPSTEAYKVAIDLAGRSRGEIVLLHVIASPTAYTTSFAGEPFLYDPAYYTRMEDEARQELDKVKAQTGANSIAVTTEVQFGTLLTTVLNTIKARNIDLVLMGTSGASGIAEILIGSNTEKVVRFSPVPVLAIRDAVDTKSIRNILLPSTLELNQHDFIKKLKELQQFMGATVHVLLVNTPVRFRQNKEANEALNDFAKHYQLTDYKLHFKNYYREEEGIMEFARAEKMDLIAMPTHARKGLSHLFNPSVTEHVVNHAQVPIWTYCLKP